jgi:hypothetical protein
MEQGNIFRLCENFLSTLDQLLDFTEPDNGSAPIDTAELVMVHDKDYYLNIN